MANGSTPLRESLYLLLLAKTQETVTGDVKLKLYKGNISKCWNDFSLFLI